jgi:hypothetical protein
LAPIDIIQAYSLRWLVEVFFEDWKLYEGWGQRPNNLTKRDQPKPDSESIDRPLSPPSPSAKGLHRKQTTCVYRR